MGTGAASLRDPELPPPVTTSSELAADDDTTLVSEEGLEEETIISKVSKVSSNNTKVTASDWHEDEPTGPAQLVVKSPMKNFFLHFFHWFEALAIISCLGVLTTQLIPLIVVPLNELGFLQTVLRAYVSLFSVTFILVELRVTLGFLKKSHLLQTYFSRGFLYTFLGVIGMEEAYSGRIDDMVHHASTDFHVAWAPLFMQISSWLVFVIGCVYMIFGVCCLQLVRDNLDKQHKKQVKEFQSL
jgi:hypothetical protein